MDSNETNIFQIDEDLASSLQELEIDELQVFAELHANHEDDSQTEMFIYACFRLCRRTGAREWAVKALVETEKWLASTLLDDATKSPDSSHLQQKISDIPWKAMRQPDQKSQRTSFTGADTS